MRTPKESVIFQGDSLDVLKTFEPDSVDAVVCDPPFGYSFMGKDWDKAVPSVDLWKECLRVLKPGGWCMVMSAPRSDVQAQMITRLTEAGYRLDFTPIYWTYASGFPKAGNVSKLVDKRMGAERTEVIGTKNPHLDGKPRKNQTAAGNETYGKYNVREMINGKYPILAPATDQAKALDGSYAGFQPKPAVEVVIVAMKPLSEKTYVDQALANGKGITWLDDCRVPTGDSVGTHCSNRNKQGMCLGHRQAMTSLGGGVMRHSSDVAQSGRFPANLLVSDDVLDVHSKYFDLDAWADTLPFLTVPKASKTEKSAGTDSNSHPTVKPLKLMSYLITLTTREGDVVLDPFVGSGTTAVAATALGRIGIGIERESEYATIAAARLLHAKRQ